jgi:hypothetical protein
MFSSQRYSLSLAFMAFDTARLIVHFRWGIGCIRGKIVLFRQMRPLAGDGLSQVAARYRCPRA